MKVIQRLERAGYTRQQIADGAQIGLPALAMYRRGDRFPSRKTYICFVEMAEAKGLVLMARDFLPDPDKTSCEETGSPAPSKSEARDAA